MVKGGGPRGAVVSAAASQQVGRGFNSWLQASLCGVLHVLLLFALVIQLPPNKKWELYTDSGCFFSFMSVNGCLPLCRPLQ